jgi:DUF4097 and DUF4098 domain-containing protein YvlB
VRVIAGADGETVVELTAIHGDATARELIARAQVELRGDEVVVLVERTRFQVFGLGGGIEAIVTAPPLSTARVSTGSGEIETQGTLGDVRAQTGSGAIRLAAVGEATARTGSGAIVVDKATGSVDAKTGSGKIAIGQAGGDAHATTGSGEIVLGCVAGRADVTTGSGRVEVDEAGDGLKAFSASGAISVRRADHGKVLARTISGRVAVGVAQGAAAYLDISTMSGRVHSELETCGPPADGEKAVELRIETMSGNVDITRAA